MKTNLSNTLFSFGRRAFIGSLLCVAGAVLLPEQVSAQDSGPNMSVIATPLPAPFDLPQDFEWVGGLALTSGDQRLGGVSGLGVGLVPASGENALSFFAVTDSGNLLSGEFEFSLEPAFSLKGLRDNQLSVQRLRDANTNLWARQAEALAIWNQRLAVGFEGQHRVGVMEEGTQITDLPIPTALRNLQRSQGGIEALATLPNGQLFAVSEGIEREGGLRAWLYAGQADDWPILVYEWDGLFAPTGADVTPDGQQLIVSERKFVSMREPLSNRLMTIPVDHVFAGNRLAPKMIIDLDPILGAVANVESVAMVPTDVAGEVLVFVATDNNFIGLLPTMIAVLRWRPT